LYLHFYTAGYMHLNNGLFLLSTYVVSIIFYINGLMQFGTI